MYLQIQCDEYCRFFFWELNTALFWLIPTYSISQNIIEAVEISWFFTGFSLSLKRLTLLRIYYRFCFCVQLVSCSTCIWCWDTIYAPPWKSGLGLVQANFFTLNLTQGDPVQKLQLKIRFYPTNPEPDQPHVSSGSGQKIWPVFFSRKKIWPVDQVILGCWV